MNTFFFIVLLMEKIEQVIMKEMTMMKIVKENGSEARNNKAESESASNKSGMFYSCNIIILN